ncbi:uncharacterized protein LOC116349330 [Contarinia nasturtii]|uniref:uncharacterized protein LOC116349330 n=1 Tax=Contarinia nasturtii TaxID=265458 RepID=UPI0012D3A241|nr:uncharacterized protein LOC116349330 [Contarinia nasturtii]
MKLWSWLLSISSQMILFFGIPSKLYSSPTLTSIEMDNDHNRLKSSNDTLIFAHVLYRHGDRNIERTFPNDRWGAECNWLGAIEPNSTVEYIATFRYKTHTDTPITARLKS